MRNYSALALASVYGVSIVDGLMVGTAYNEPVPKPTIDMLWRNLAVPGWGDVYAGQPRGWIYTGIWAISTGVFIYSIFNAADAEKKYNAATTGLDAQYANLNAAWQLRNIGTAAFIGIYAAALVDGLMLGTAQQSAPSDISGFGIIWRNLVIPGWGDIYAAQPRGWIYTGLWGITASAVIYSVINTAILENKYKTAKTGLESAYANYNAAWKMRTYSIIALAAVYATGIVDGVITAITPGTNNPGKVSLLILPEDANHIGIQLFYQRKF